jgi:hypothetical protein
MELGCAIFREFSVPIASAKTDADGKFSIMLDSKAAVALAAHGTRMVADKVENYYWIVSVPLEARQPARQTHLPQQRQPRNI